jgi:hypothetical protein
MPGAINYNQNTSISSLSTPNTSFYSDLNKICSPLDNNPALNGNNQTEKTDAFVSTAPKKEEPKNLEPVIAKAENEPAKKSGWGPVKIAVTALTLYAAARTGNGLDLKGKNIKEMAKTVFNKETGKAFLKNCNPLNWIAAAPEKPGFLNTAEDLIHKRFAKKA